MGKPLDQIVDRFADIARHRDSLAEVNAILLPAAGALRLA